MILKAPYWLRQVEVLGLNRRNAEYIMRYNPRSAFPLVDDKVLTKRLAAQHQIPTPSLYHIIENHGDIVGLRKRLGDQHQFVVKPARGAGGSGIILITDIKPEGFIKQNGEIISQDDFSYHIFDVLSGIYSLEGLEDRALFEALVHPDPVFSDVSYQGVPDIRIVVYRGVPVMGMVRLPTKASDGKANLHRGAIGAGIEITTGRTLAAVHHAEVLTHHPDTGNPVSGIQVPSWSTILLMAARSYEMTKLGYIGVDIVIDRERGPLLLEINARPGLAIQLANRMGLRKRLEEIDKAPTEVFAKPEDRIEWAEQKFV